MDLSDILQAVLEILLSVVLFLFGLVAAFLGFLAQTLANELGITFVGAAGVIIIFFKWLGGGFDED